MKLIQKKQTGTEQKPSALTYGELAVSKKGRLYVGAEGDVVADPLEPALRGLSMAEYGLRMFQLEAAMQNKTPPMLGGFIEAFGDATKQHSISSCVVNTSGHYLDFNAATTPSEKSVTYSSVGDVANGFVDGALGAKIPVAGISNPTRVTFTFYGSIGALSPTITATGEKIVGTTRLSATGKQNGSTYVVTVQLGADLIEAIDLDVDFGDMVTLRGATGKGDFTELMGAGIGTPMPRCDCTIYGPGDDAEPIDGTYITKAVNLGTKVTEGELYLYTNGGSGIITPSVSTTTGGHREISSSGPERQIYLGGRTAYERQYRIPEMAETETLSVKVLGHRYSAAEALRLYAICVAMR